MIGRIAAPFDSEDKNITLVVNTVDNAYSSTADPKDVISSFELLEVKIFQTTIP